MKVKYNSSMFWKIFVNALTSARLILAVLFSFTILFNPNFLSHCIIIYIIAITTDFLDGKLARYFNVTSLKGAIFDVIADFLFITITCITLAMEQLLPFFIIIVIILKLIEFFTTSKIVNKNSNNENKFLHDPFGHLVALMFYALPLISILLFSLLSFHKFSTIIFVICIIITFMAIISSSMRIYGVLNKKYQ